MAVEVHEYIPTVHEKPHCKITSDKFAHEFHVMPQFGGFVFYEIRVSKGILPKELEGRFTRMKAAVDAVKEYERKAQPSNTVKRAERNAAKVQRDSQEHVRSGSDHGEEPANLS